MAEITVNFLSNSYTFPNEIHEYTAHCKRFQAIKNDLSDKMLEGLQLPPVDDNFRFIGFLERDLPAAMELAGKKVIDMLVGNGIFDITLHELVEQNDGFIRQKSIQQSIVTQISSNMQNHLLALRVGQIEISSNAFSQVIGSGITVYSSSIADHLAFSMLETGVLHKQYSQASKEYESAMTKFVSKAHSDLDRKNAAAIVERLPDIVEAIDVFTSSMAKVYFTKLQEDNVFDYSKIENYSLEHSGELLKNLDIVEDKNAVLCAAFKTCPYNVDIYTAMLELGIEDQESYVAAKDLGIADILSERIRDYCKEKKSTGTLPKFSIAVLAILTSQNLTDTLRKILEEEISAIVNEYRETKQAISNDHKLDSWIRKFIVKETDRLILFDEKQIENRITEAIHNIGDNTPYRTLICERLLPSDLLNISERSIAMFGEFESIIINSLFLRTKEYINEAKRRKAAYDCAVKENSDAVNECNRKIEQLRKELKASGFFAFSKRSEINREIDAELNKKQKLTTDTQHIDKLKRAFVEMYR